MRKRQVKEDKPGVDLGVINMVSIEPTANALKFMAAPEVEDDDRIPVGIHRLYPDVEVPKYATQLSACFDLRAYFRPRHHLC